MIEKKLKMERKNTMEPLIDVIIRNLEEAMDGLQHLSLPIEEDEFNKDPQKDKREAFLVSFKVVESVLEYLKEAR